MTVAILDCCAGRLGRLLIVLVGGLAIGIVAMSPAHLILLLNGIGLSAAAGVTTAYLPVAGQALGRSDPTRGDVLGLGIFLAGLSDVALRLESLVSRDLGRPSVLNTPLAAISIFLGVTALFAFLWAPHAEDAQVPREKWGRAGLLVAAGVAITFAAGVAHHALTPAPLIRLE